MKKWIALACLITVVALVWVGLRRAVAQENTSGSPLAPISSGFTYQGELKNSVGDPINASCDFRFRLWNAETGGAQVGGDSTPMGVNVANGYFTAGVNAGGEFGASAFNGQARWLEIGVKCGSDSGFTTLSRRQALTVAPYASYATNADAVDGQHASAFATASHNHWGASWSGSGTGLSLSGGTTGISGSGTTYGIYGQSASTNGRGVYGEATSVSGVTYGVYGKSDSTFGRGLYGISANTSGLNYGVYGETRSSSGIGVYGLANATAGTTYGVYGRSDSLDTLSAGVYGYGFYYGIRGYGSATTTWSTGVFGQSDSSTGAGVFGYASANTGDTEGVIGRTDSPTGRGVYGYANATTGEAYGVFGRSYSTEGTGVYGEAIDGLAGVYGLGEDYGVIGRVDSSTSFASGIYGTAHASTGLTVGVFGDSSSTNGTGVLGYTYAGSGTTYGVFGKVYSPEGYGGYFENLSGGIALSASSYTTGDIFTVYSAAGIVFRVNGDGNVHADGGYHCGNDLSDSAGDLNESELEICLYDSSPADFAEMLPAANAARPLEPGDVLVVDPDGKLALSTQPYQSSVVGVYSTRPSYLGNSQMWGKDGYAPLALTGVVPVKVSTENGAIQPGDLLVASSTPGYAMRGGANPPNGTVIGKALGTLDSGTGTILVLVMLQ